MADFVAVLKKTLDGLSDTTPQMREKVYEKARITIAGKLATMNPPLPGAVIERQKQALEEAIVKVEGEYNRKPALDPLTELENVFASLKNPDPRAVLKEPAAKPVAKEPVVAGPVAEKPVAPQPAKPVDKPAAPAPAKTADKPLPAPALKPVEKPAPAPVKVEEKPPVAATMAPVVEKPATPVEKAPPAVTSAPAAKPALVAAAQPAAKAPAPKETVLPVSEQPPLPTTEWFRPSDDEPESASPADDHERMFYAPDASDREEIVTEEEEPVRRRGYGRLIAAAAVLAILAGGGYGIWAKQDQVRDLLARVGIPGFGPSTSSSSAPEPAQPDAARAPDVAAVEPPATTEPAPSAPEPASTGPEKFTQRLNADGTESDAGPSSGPPVIGEGTSIAAVTQPPGSEPPTPAAPDSQPQAPDASAQAPAEGAQPPAGPPVEPGAPAAPDAAAQTPPAQPSQPGQTEQPSVLVGQKAIFYEERTNVAEASAEPGSIVWTLVQESPGGDLPPEPAIRAEATIPGKDVQLRMTIRRNADRTLPASHIVEMIFLTPQGFEGGGIENVLRLSMKGSEQEAGSPLLGIPAKIADGFFLIALNDSKPEIEANTNLLRGKSWIDVPVQYKSGRRALFTMEKGIPGAKVFDEALKAWQSASSG